MVELLQEVDPIVYDQAADKVLYTGSFSHVNPDLFELDNQDKMDFERVKDMTNWDHEQNPQLIDTTPAKPREKKPDLVALFNANYWTKANPCVHIGIFNKHKLGEPVSFEIEIQEHSFESMLSPAFSKLYEVNQAVF